MNLFRLVAVAAFGVGIVSSAIATLVASVPLFHKNIPWYERARRAFPLRIVSGMFGMLGTFVIGIVGTLLLDPFTTSSQLDSILVALAGAAGIAIPLMLAMWRFIWPHVPLSKFIGGCFNGIFVRFPNSVLLLLALLGMAATHFKVNAVIMIMVVMTLASIAVVFGGGVIACRFLGLAQPALPRVANAAAWAGERLSIKPTAVYEMSTARSSITNVYPASGIVVVPSGAPEVLSDQELLALLVWEMSMLAQPRITSIIKALDSLYVVFMLAFMVTHRDSPKAMLYVWVASIAMILGSRALARRAQLQADKKAAELGLASQDALRALHRVYESDLLPVVSTSNSAVTPHLYDRLTGAGIDPGYERPKSPSKLRIFFSVLCGVAAIVVLWIALLVFGRGWGII